MTDIQKNVRINHILCEICTIYISYEQYEKIQSYYFEPSRHWHNWTHVINVVDYIWNSDLSQDNKELLLIVAFLHDAIYDTKSKTNEEDSAKLVNQFNLPNSQKKIISDIILFTKYQRYDDNILERTFQYADLNIFLQSPAKQLEFEKAIFKEYYWVPIPKYVEARIVILKDLHDRYNCDTKFLIDYLGTKIWNVGFYCGSFNPLHIGHKSIILQAEKIFDKVILGKAICKNTKTNSDQKFDIQNINREIIEYDGLIIDIIKSFEYNITIIRGLRNGTDLLYEQNFALTVKDILPQQEFIYFFTAPELNHVSSSMIRELNHYDPKLITKYTTLTRL